MICKPQFMEIPRKMHLFDAAKGAILWSLRGCGSTRKSKMFAIEEPRNPHQQRNGSPSALSAFTSELGSGRSPEDESSDGGRLLTADTRHEVCVNRYWRDI